jgi:colicin import membrane protein
MQIQEIPRNVVKGYLRAARLPLTAAESVLRRGQETEDWAPTMAFEGVEANVKQVLGSLLRDEKLVEEGRLSQAKLAQLRKAAELEAVAQQHKVQADAEYQQRRQADEQRARQVEQQADAREAAVKRQQAEDKRRVEAEARRKEEAAAKAQEATDKAIAKQERAARATRIAAEQEALAEERNAVAAKADVIELDKKLDATKAARKAKASR